LEHHQGLTGAARAPVQDGRQPRQLDRQPRGERGRLRSVREPGGPGADHLLLGRRRRARAAAARLALLELAVVGSLEPAVHDRAMSRRTKGRKELEERIGYGFADKALLESALTHISALSGPSRSGSYQRLEFLGDHVLGLVISDMLFRAFPKANEGELSRRLADLVRKETCADVARALDLGAAIKLGASEANAGGRRRLAILDDVREALIGAVFLDGGYAAAAALLERLWGDGMRAPARRVRRGGAVRPPAPTGARAAPGRPTPPSSACRSRCRSSSRPKGSAAPSAPPSRPLPPPCWRARGLKRPSW